MSVSASPSVNKGNLTYFRYSRRQGEVLEQNLLADLFRATATLVGEDLIETILRSLSQVLRVNHVILGETLGGSRIRVRQCCSVDRDVVGFEYDATEFACERVIGPESCCYPAGARRLLPKHPLIRKLGAEGYIGIPLFGRDSNPIGLLAVLHDAPLREPDIAWSVCTPLALRISAELERMHAEQNLRRSERYFRKVALNDELTGLPNRRLLMNRLEHSVARVRRYGLPLALLFLDLDGFKQVNDRAGHDMGDQVLAEAARRIASCARSADTVARLGGDEFVILLEQFGTESAARTVAEHALSVFSRPIHISGHCWYLSTSIGISLYDGSSPDIDALDLLKQADTAMYTAKQSAPGRCRFFFSTHSRKSDPAEAPFAIHACPLPRIAAASPVIGDDILAEELYG